MKFWYALEKLRKQVFQPAHNCFPAFCLTVESNSGDIATHINFKSNKNAKVGTQIFLVGPQIANPQILNTVPEAKRRPYIFNEKIYVFADLRKL